MTLYLDTSAMLELYVEESESEACDLFLSSDADWSTARLTLVEVRRNLPRLLTDDDLVDASEQFTADWQRTRVVDLDAEVCSRAAVVAEQAGVRTLDALHIAATRSLEQPTVVTYDDRMAAAARERGLRVVSPGSEVADPQTRLDERVVKGPRRRWIIRSSPRPSGLQRRQLVQCSLRCAIASSRVRPDGTARTDDTMSTIGMPRGAGFGDCTHGGGSCAWQGGVRRGAGAGGPARPRSDRFDVWLAMVLDRYAVVRPLLLLMGAIGGLTVTARGLDALVG